jgi:large subunit ribosomal protein L15
MQLHELKPKNAFRRKKRVGRGGKKGTYAGKGGKGQTRRSGFRLKPLVREWLKKYPKLRGYRFSVIEEAPDTVDIAALEKKFSAQEIVTPKTLAEKKLIHSKNGKLPKVKIMGDGEITKILIISGCKVSKKAKQKIEKVGGEIKIRQKKAKVLTEKEPKAKIKEKGK